MFKMKFFETSKYHSLKKSTYINLRWIGIIGQLFSIYLVYFFFKFDFDFFYANLIILIGVISNLYLIFFYKKTQLSDRSALTFLLIDIIQLGFLIYFWRTRSCDLNNLSFFSKKKNHFQYFDYKY